MKTPIFHPSKKMASVRLAWTFHIIKETLIGTPLRHPSIRFNLYLSERLMARINSTATLNKIGTEATIGHFYAVCITITVHINLPRVNSNFSKNRYTSERETFLRFWTWKKIVCSARQIC